MYGYILSVPVCVCASLSLSLSFSNICVCVVSPQTRARYFIINISRPVPDQFLGNYVLCEEYSHCAESTEAVAVSDRSDRDRRTD